MRPRLYFGAQHRNNAGTITDQFTQYFDMPQDEDEVLEQVKEYLADGYTLTLNPCE